MRTNNILSCFFKVITFSLFFVLFFLFRFLPLTFSIRPGSRLLDGCVSDDTEATALTFNIRLIDVCVPLPGPSGPAGGRWMGRTAWQSGPQGSELSGHEDFHLPSQTADCHTDNKQSALLLELKPEGGENADWRGFSTYLVQHIARTGWPSAWWLQSIQAVPKKLTSL